MSKERFFRFIAIILVIFTFIFIGWALWNHFFGQNTTPQNNQNTSEIKIEDKNENQQNSKENSDKKSGENGENSTSKSGNSDSKENSNQNAQNGDLNGAKNSAESDQINNTTPAELPKTGVDFQF